MISQSKARLKYASYLVRERKARIDSEHGTALPLPCVNYLSSLGLKLEKQPRRCLGAGAGGEEEEWGKITRSSRSSSSSSPGKTAPGRTLDRNRSSLCSPHSPNREREYLPRRRCHGHYCRCRLLRRRRPPRCRCPRRLGRLQSERRWSLKSVAASRACCCSCGPVANPVAAEVRFWAIAPVATLPP